LSFDPRDALLTFFDFPAEHWTHLRTSNPIESAFATVRHRTVRMKVRRGSKLDAKIAPQGVIIAREFTRL
jgi:transposase-like protein